jgi:hypothetical protein
MCCKYNYLSIINVITCLHPFMHNKLFKKLKKTSFLKHKNYLVIFFTSCSLSTSLHMYIHSCITNCFYYQYDILCTHWNEKYFGGLHCNEMLNVIILTCAIIWIFTHDMNFFLRYDKTILVCVTRHISHVMWIFKIELFI